MDSKFYESLLGDVDTELSPFSRIRDHVYSARNLSLGNAIIYYGTDVSCLRFKPVLALNASAHRPYVHQAILQHGMRKCISDIFINKSVKLHNFSALLPTAQFQVQGQGAWIYLSHGGSSSAGHSSTCQTMWRVIEVVQLSGTWLASHGPWLSELNSAKSRERDIHMMCAWKLFGKSIQCRRSQWTFPTFHSRRPRRPNRRHILPHSRRPYIFTDETVGASFLCMVVRNTF